MSRQKADRKICEPLEIIGFSTLSTGKTPPLGSRKTTFCDDFGQTVMRVLQIAIRKNAILRAFLPPQRVCKTYVSIHKLCNMHKCEKSQKSPNFLREFCVGKAVGYAEILTFGNIFCTFYLTVKKLLRQEKSMQNRNDRLQKSGSSISLLIESSAPPHLPEPGTTPRNSLPHISQRLPKGKTVAIPKFPAPPQVSK